MSNCKKLSIAFSFFLFLFFGEIVVNIACGPEPDPYDYYISYFHNDVQGADYEAFSFTDLSFLYSEDEPKKESDINSQEWADYLGEGTKPKDVFALMYRANRETDSLVATWRNKKRIVLPDSLKSNTFLQVLAKNKKAFDYYLFSKACEGLVTYLGDPWNPEPRDTVAMQQFAAQSLKQMKKVKGDDFLRLRYAYQVVRLYHYAADFERCLSAYEAYIASNPYKSAVQGWALALKAGALRWLGDKEEAAFLFSKVFQSNPERRVQAYKNYHYIKVDRADVLARASSNEERAVIWTIDGFNQADFGLQTLRKVYQLAPESILNGILLMREVNKLEAYLLESPLNRDAYGYRYYYNGNDSLVQKARLYADSLSQFSLRLAADKKYQEPAFGTVAAAYIHWMKGDIKQAEALLTSVDVSRLSAKLADQYRIAELLVQASLIKGEEGFNPDKLVPALKWLDRKRAAEKEALDEKGYWPYAQKNFRFSRTARNFYQSLLAPKYIELQDTAMAAILMAKGDQYWKRNGKQRDTLFKYSSYETVNFWQQRLQPGALLRIKALREERDINRKGFAAFVTEALPALPNDDYFELLGTSYLRTHEYAKAVASFRKLSHSYKFWTASNWYSIDEEADLHADPFLTTINDYPKAYTDKGLNKLEFAEQMLALERQIKSDPHHAADYYFAMANGIYQTGTYGNSWYLISYSWNHSDAYISGVNYYDDDYKHAKQAIAWYKKALSLSEDLEFKARCTFMLAKCEQKKFGYQNLSDYYSSYTYDGPDPLWLFSMKNKYFVNLERYYKETAFYKRAIGECSYLSDFVAAN